MSINKPAIPVSSIYFTPNKDLEGVTITVKRTENANSGFKGTSYQSFSITKSGITNDDISSAVFQFSINTSWFTKNGLDDNRTVMQRKEEGSGAWEQLKTQKILRGNEAMTYQAVSEGFSDFVITSEKRQVHKKVVEKAENKTLRNESSPVALTAVSGEQRSEPSTAIGAMVIIAIIALSSVIYFIVRKSKRNKKP